MHELSVAAEVHRVARAALDGREGTIRRVKVRVGELSAVEPSLLGYAWESLVAGGPDDGAALEIEWCRARQTCAVCGGLAERAQGSWMRICPSCAGPVRTEGGDELDVVSVIFDEDEGGRGDGSRREEADPRGERGGGDRAEGALP